jgi:hypothetical protein
VDFELILAEGIRAGQFGGSIEPHGDHAMGFVHFLGETPFRGVVIDLGSGAGLPALILAVAFPETTWTLVERRAGRTDLLRRAVHRLNLLDRVEVVTGDAATVGWSDLRGTADWVTARSFGTPGDTAEVAAPLLRTGGSLLVSEPIETRLESRWPSAGLQRCGLAFAEEWSVPSGRYLRLERTADEIPTLPRKGARKTPVF